MFVIRRKPGEAIVIGDGVEVRVVDVAGTRVKLGVVAPRQVRVRRKEVEVAGRENQAAAQPAAGPALAAVRRLLAPGP